MGRIKSEMTDYRKQLRGRILETSLQMFKKQGFKAVKMDDISKALTISKRTLYEIYPNKEDLIFETVSYGMKLSHDMLVENISKTSGDTMDVLTEFFRMHVAESSDANTCLIDDIQQYPKVNEFIKEHRRNKASRIVEFFKKGQKEGYFVEDVNVDVFLHMNNAVSSYFISERLFSEFSSRELLRTLLQTFVRGVCTPKGMQRIDELLATI